MFRATLCSSSGGHLYQYNFWYNHCVLVAVRYAGQYLGLAALLPLKPKGPVQAYIRIALLCNWNQKDEVNEKISTTPSGIEPATSRLVAQCLNYLSLLTYLTSICLLTVLLTCICLTTGFFLCDLEISRAVPHVSWRHTGAIYRHMRYVITCVGARVVEGVGKQ
jgi:hypothetical protein